MKRKSSKQFTNAILNVNECICGGNEQGTTYSGPNDTLGYDLWDGCRMIYFK